MLENKEKIDLKNKCILLPVRRDLSVPIWLSAF